MFRSKEVRFSDQKKDKSKDAFENWKKVKNLGSGGFGAVQLWKNSSNDSTVAVKYLVRKNDNNSDLVKLKQRWRDEFKMMNNLRSDYIVKGVCDVDPAFVKFMNENFSQGSDFPVIFMEFCNAGDLREVLQKPENMNGLSEFEVKEIMKSLSHAIEHLHSIQIEHRDLKPENILIHEKNGQRLYKVSDFGLARKNEIDKTIVQSRVGTKFYFAPEVLEGKYSKSIDYWSFGIIVFEITCGVLPFLPHESIPKIIEAILKKSRSCIAITENPNTKELEEHHRLFAQNRLSKVFENALVPWLQMSLDVDRKNRGVGSAGRITIFENVAQIVQKKILTVYCINNLKYYYYDLETHNTMSRLKKAFLADFHSEPEVIFPLFHPVHLKIKNNCNLTPMDFYNEDWKDSWRDSRDTKQHPAAMLYVFVRSKDQEPSLEATTTQSNFQFTYRNDMIFTPTISKCLLIPSAKLKNLPCWYVREFALQAHHLICEEERRLKGLLCAMRDFALKYEDNLSNYERISEVLCNDCLILSAKFDQFALMAPMNASEMNNLSLKVNFWRTVRDKIRERQRSATNIIRKELEEELYDNKLNEDVFNLHSFRLQLSNYLRGGEQSKVEMFNLAKNAVNHCTKTRTTLYSKDLLKHIRNILDAVHLYITLIKVYKQAVVDLAEHNKALYTESQCYKAKLLESSVTKSVAATNSALMNTLEKMVSEMTSNSMTLPTTVLDLINN